MLPDLDGARWRKSRASGSEGGSCIELAWLDPVLGAVRDSKNPDGGALPADLPALIAAVKKGRV